MFSIPFESHHRLQWVSWRKWSNALCKMHSTSTGTLHLITIITQFGKPHHGWTTLSCSLLYNKLNYFKWENQICLEISLRITIEQLYYLRHLGCLAPELHHLLLSYHERGAGSGKYHSTTPDSPMPECLVFLCLLRRWPLEEQGLTCVLSF